MCGVGCVRWHRWIEEHPQGAQADVEGFSRAERVEIACHLPFRDECRLVSQMYLRTALRLSEALQCDPVDFLTEGY